MENNYEAGSLSQHNDKKDSVKSFMKDWDIEMESTRK
jgi:hypothetical protein